MSTEIHKNVSTESPKEIFDRPHHLLLALVLLPGPVLTLEPNLNFLDLAPKICFSLIYMF